MLDGIEHLALDVGSNTAELLHECRDFKLSILEGILNDFAAAPPGLNESREGEGSGYNLIYELNAKEAKLPLEVDSSYNEFKVVQRAEIIDVDLLPLLDYVMQNYQLSQKSFIAFGIIARERKILSTQLTKQLQLSEDDRLRSYIDKIL